MAKKEIFGDRWTVDFEEFMEWFTETEAIEATESTKAVEAKTLTPFALAVREAIIKNRPEDEFVDESESDEELPQFCAWLSVSSLVPRSLVHCP